MDRESIEKTRQVTVFGGSGFLGRHVARALVGDGWRIRIACRRPELAADLQSLGAPGQVELVRSDLRDPATIGVALESADAAVNLVGILAESGEQTFAAVMSQGALALAQAVAKAGVAPFVHVSALGASKDARSDYARNKAQGEEAVREFVPQAIIFRPSIVFGPEDEFFNRFATMARLMPVLPLVGAATRFQPVFVDDIAKAVALALDGKATPGATYELGGPEVKSFRELVQFVCDVTGRRRPILPLSFETGKLMATATQLANSFAFGRLPKFMAMTTDQVELLRDDNVVSAEAKADGRTFEGLGITPQLMEAIVPTYVSRERESAHPQV